MSTHIHMFLTGTLLSVSFANFMQCELAEPGVARDDDTLLAPGPAPALAPSTAKLEELGKRVFFDKISVPNRMACASCHAPEAGWTIKNAGVNQHQVAVTGADPHTAGSIKPPSNAYASKIGRFGACDLPPTGFCGGNFWDGRAEGNPVSSFPDTATGHVGDEVFDNVSQLKSVYDKFLGPVADQALNPFPNPVEQNIEIQQVCKHVAASKYAEVFKAAWGEAINCSDAPYGSKGLKAFEVNFRRIALALAAWQDSKEVNSFSSKRDLALAADKDKKFPLDGLTAQENRGHDLFYATFLTPVTIDGVQKFANCALCHSDNPPVFGTPPGDNGSEPLQVYSDDAFHNIGSPANPEIEGFPELNVGLEGHNGEPDHRGHQKTPTLRNVDKRPGKGFTKAYTHNGWFKSLEHIVHFYNTALTDGATAKSFGVTRCDPKSKWTAKQALAANCWPMPEHPENTAIGLLLGDLKLTAEDEAAIVAYLKTITDTLTPTAPKP